MIRFASALVACSLLALATLPSCSAEAGSIRTTRVTLPTPFGPLIIEQTVDGRQQALTNSGRRVTENGHDYEVYTDPQGREYLRDTQPPNQITPRSAIRANSRGGAGIVNTRITSQAAHWDFTRHGYAELCRLTGLDRQTGRQGVSERSTGGQVLFFDSKTGQAHVVYSVRQDIGIPYPDDHPAVLFDLQLQPGPTPATGFLSVAVEGDIRDVAEWLMAQGLTRLEGAPVLFRDATYAVNVQLDRAGRRVVFTYGSSVLLVTPLREDGYR